MRVGMLNRIMRQTSSGAFVPTLSSLSLTGTTIPDGAAAGTVVGAIVGTTGGSTLALSDTQGSRFALSSTTAPSNLIAGATATNYGTATTHAPVIVETKSGAVGSPKPTTLSVSVTQIAPANTVAPAITGTTTVGQLLTCSTGTWTGSATITYGYVWKNDGIAISGATSSTYTTVSGDQGHTITCTVTATNGLGSASATTAAVGPISSSGLSAPAIAFDTANGWVAGDNPPKIQVTLNVDASAQVGDILVRQYATNSGFSTGLVTEYHTISSDDVLNGDLTIGAGTLFPFATAIAGGLTYFRCAIGRGGTGILGGFALISSFSTSINDTLGGTTATSRLDNVNSTKYQHNLTFSNTLASPLTILGLNSGGGFYQAASTTQAPPGNKFCFGVTADVALASATATFWGIHDDTTDFSAGGYGTGTPGIKNSNGFALYVNLQASNAHLSWYAAGALVSSLSTGAPWVSTDTWETEFDLSGSAGSHVIRVYLNATLFKTLTGLTLTGFTRPFVGVQNNGKATLNPGNTFTHTLTSGVVSIG